MKYFDLDGVKVEYHDSISEEEARQYAKEEIKTNPKMLASIEIMPDLDFAVIRGLEKSPIRRIRRITGYLSEIGNFNEAKKAELSERQVHGM